MEWVSGSDRPRLFQRPPRHAAIDGLLLRRQNPSRSDQCRPGSAARSAVFCPRLKNENADGEASLSDTEVWTGGREGEMEGEGEGVRNVRTRSQGDGSPGSPSVWQLWKFIAIDFVISSLSIGSTWAHWWIARKLFLQSCFLKSSPPPRTGSGAFTVSRPPFFPPICWDVSISLFFFFLYFAPPVPPRRSRTFHYGPVQIRFIAKVCALLWFVKLQLWNQPAWKNTRDNDVTAAPHLLVFYFLFSFFLPFVLPLASPPDPLRAPPPFTFTLQNDLLHFTTVDLKTVRVRNVSRSWEYSCSTQWIWGEVWNLFCLLLSRVVKYAAPRWVESSSQWHGTSVPESC